MKNKHWEKGGLILKVSGEYGWMNTHAQVPTPILLGEKIRIYFSTRTIQTESKTTFVDVDAKNPKKILYLHDRAIIANGSAGTFDEHGVMPSAIKKDKNNNFLLYYSGWSRRNSVPYSNLTGLAISKDGINFKKMFDGPILSTNRYEPYSATSPCLITKEKEFYLFYCSGCSWEKINNKYEHTYDIKLAKSQDGIVWFQDGKTRIKKNYELEAITRPTVLELNNEYHMYFCCRGSEDFRNGLNAYRIGYAYSKDLISWERNDKKSGINIGSDSWENKMIAYPSILKTPYGIYMFYNGNGFGYEGFGFAKLSDYEI